MIILLLAAGLSVATATTPLVGRWTPYTFVRGDLPPLPEDLEPVSIYLIARHGGTNMGPEAAAGMAEMAARLVETAPLPWLQGWEKGAILTL